MKKVWFKNSRGQRLAGILHEPKSKTKAVILLHGFGGDKDEGGLFVRTAEALCNIGFASLRFDFAGSGESDGGFSEMSFTSETEDMASAIAFMRNLGYKKIGVVGQSFGGVISIIGYSKETKTMVLWNPVARMQGFRNYLDSQNPNWRQKAEEDGKFRLYKERLKKYLFAGKNLVDEVESVDIFSGARKVSCPVLVVHGEKDSILPWKDSEELVKVLKEPKRLEIVKGAEHGFHDPESEKSVIKLTLDWFKKYL